MMMMMMMTSGQSGSGSNGNKGVLCIPQIYCHTEASGKPPANAAVKNSQKSKITIIIIIVIILTKFKYL